MRMKRRTYRRLRAITWSIVAIAVLAIIGSALGSGGSHNPGTLANSPSPTPTLALAHGVANASKKAPAKHKHHRRSHHSAAAPAVTTPPPVAAPTGCYPISDEGTCYEPGEYCRYDDEGTSGVAGDGEAITCEDNDGWRWEPS